MLRSLSKADMQTSNSIYHSVKKIWEMRTMMETEKDKTYKTSLINNRRYLGNKYKLLPFITRVVNEECKVYSEGKIIHICCRDASNQEKIQHQFENWWRKQSKKILLERTEHWYPIIEKYGIPIPTVAI